MYFEVRYGESGSKMTRLVSRGGNISQHRPEGGTDPKENNCKHAHQGTKYGRVVVYTHRAQHDYCCERQQGRPRPSQTAWENSESHLTWRYTVPPSAMLRMVFFKSARRPVKHSAMWNQWPAATSDSGIVVSHGGGVRVHETFPRAFGPQLPASRPSNTLFSTAPYGPRLPKSLQKKSTVQAGSD